MHHPQTERGIFSTNYLLSFSDGEFETFDVLVARTALNVARKDGRASASALVDRFLDGDMQSLVQRIILGENDENEKQPNQLPDRYLFGTPIKFEVSSAEKRKCYEEALGAMGIRIPFDKSGMYQLLKAIDPYYNRKSVENLAQLSDFIWEFVISSWPLFEASIIHIPMRYFTPKPEVDLKGVTAHLQLMGAYGLERLLGRLVVLQAVCGSAWALEAIEPLKVIEQCEYQAEHILSLKAYFDGVASGIERNDLRSVGKGNPIQRATFLVIYLNEAQGPYDFLERLVDVFDIDPTVLRMIDWDPLLEIIERTSDYFYTPEVVAMAAILSGDGVLQESPLVERLYIPTSANTDFFNYARHCREELKLTPHQFFASFSKLPLSVQAAIFEYMLKPGQMDSIANIFPSSGKISAEIERSYAVNALTIKLDCLSYLKKRKVLDGQQIRAVEESTRQRLRQIKYETDTSEGRIRLSIEKLTSTILEFYLDHFDLFSLPAPDTDHRQSALQNYLEDKAFEIFSEGLARHICFKSRIALDYLLSNLRHNFLRFKVESGIDEVFHSHPGKDLTGFKSAITETLDDFYRTWLTLYEDRSFFSGLVAQITEQMHRFHGNEPLPPKTIAHEIATETKSRFDALLLECRRIWTGEVKDEVIALLKDELTVSDLANETALNDAIEVEMGRVFDDAEGWLTVNKNPMNREVGLKDLFIFESTNFSSARTRIKPLEVECFEKIQDSERFIPVRRDIMVPGHLFDAIVQLVQNLLENAFKHSLLPISETEISVSIVDKFEDGILIEFRNKFDPEKKSLVNRRLISFNEKVDQARRAVLDAPIDVGGSGLRRIFFEFHSVFGGEFSLLADNTEFKNNIFVVRCALPRRNGFGYE